MENNCLVTIVVPVYNVERYLDDCVRSIVDQSYDNLEIILVDDGSTDSSGKKCDNWDSVDKRIKVIHQDNLGLSGARNTGISIAKGDYIAFIDSDDYIHRDYVKSMYEACLDNNVQLCVCGILETIDDVDTASPYEGKVELVNQEQLFDQLYTIRNVETVSAANKLYAIELFDDIRYPVGRRHEDEATIHYIIEKVSTAAWIGFPMYYYRQTPNSITRQTYNIKMLDELWSKEVRLDFFRGRGMSDLYQKALYVYCSRIISHIEMMKDYTDEEFKSASQHYKKQYLSSIKELSFQMLPLKKRLRLILYRLRYNMEIKQESGD